MHFRSAKCEMCGSLYDLWVMSWDDGQGSRIALLCTTCCWRVKYRSELRRQPPQKKEAPSL